MPITEKPYTAIDIAKVGRLADYLFELDDYK